MKKIKFESSGVQSLNSEEMIAIDGGFIFTAAIGIAIGMSFITGVGIGVALYGVTK